MRLAIDVTLDYSIEEPADVLLLVEAAAGGGQRLVAQDLRVTSAERLRAVTGKDGIGQRCWALGEGRFVVTYRAEVAIDRPPADLASLGATPPRDVPADAVPYLLPSRYCESDRFEGFVRQRFAGLEGGALAAALTEWVRTHLTYASGSTSGVTTAMMTFAERRGVCRDYAHLLVALARAGNIPARCVSAYAPGVDPPDFHAVAELWLDGGWHLIDATGMAACGEIARVAVGRDATDIAFMTVFGIATMNRQRVSVMRLDDRVGVEEQRLAPDVFDTRSRRDSMSDERKPIDDKTMDRMSVAPGDPKEADHIQHPRQDAGQDASISERLERDPQSKEAQLDTALDESMDASDPPAATQPVHSHEPPASSGYDEEAERQRDS